jgi:hypothetical protein
MGKFMECLLMWDKKVLVLLGIVNPFYLFDFGGLL